MFTSVLIKEIIYSLVVLVHNIFLTLASLYPIHGSLYIRVYATKFRNFNEEEKKKVLEHHQTVERPRKGTIGNLV